jgi:hypothetical protein
VRRDGRVHRDHALHCRTEWGREGRIAVALKIARAIAGGGASADSFVLDVLGPYHLSVTPPVRAGKAKAARR